MVKETFRAKGKDVDRAKIKVVDRIKVKDTNMLRDKSNGKNVKKVTVVSSRWTKSVVVVSSDDETDEVAEAGESVDQSSEDDQDTSDDNTSLDGFIVDDDDEATTSEYSSEEGEGEEEEEGEGGDENEEGFEEREEEVEEGKGVCIDDSYDSIVNDLDGLSLSAPRGAADTSYGGADDTGTSASLEDLAEVVPPVGRDKIMRTPAPPRRGRTSEEGDRKLKVLLPWSQTKKGRNQAARFIMTDSDSEGGDDDIFIPKIIKKKDVPTPSSDGNSTHSYYYNPLPHPHPDLPILFVLS